MVRRKKKRKVLALKLDYVQDVSVRMNLGEKYANIVIKNLLL